MRAIETTKFQNARHLQARFGVNRRRLERRIDHTNPQLAGEFRAAIDPLCLDGKFYSEQKNINKLVRSKGRTRARTIPCADNPT